MGAVTVAERLLADLRRAGATVMVAGADLRVEAPRGVLDPALRPAVAAHKGELMALVSREERGEAPAESLSGEAMVGVTVRNALALSEEERAAWRREIVEALVWVEAGYGVDIHLAHDLQALQRIVPPGTCLQCDRPSPAEGRHWCVSCSVKEVKAMEVRR
ncbi:MAG: hypothetical protein M3Q71_12945 [Chloroflexota bacterium]|nr:hypothetical protein [Chloroflexota bacterium]